MQLQLQLHLQLLLYTTTTTTTTTVTAHTAFFYPLIRRSWLSRARASMPSRHLGQLGGLTQQGQLPNTTRPCTSIARCQFLHLRPWPLQDPMWSGGGVLALSGVFALSGALALAGVLALAGALALSGVLALSWPAFATPSAMLRAVFLEPKTICRPRKKVEVVCSTGTGTGSSI